MGRGHAVVQPIHNVTVHALVVVGALSETSCVPIVLMLVLAQAPLVPSAGPARFPSQGIWWPDVMGRVSAAYSDGGWAVAWADQRRLTGQLSSDVWVATTNSNGRVVFIDGSPLDPTRIRQDALLSTNGNGWLVGWSEVGGNGWLVKVRQSTSATLNGSWSPETVVADPVVFGSHVVAAEGLNRSMAWRKPDGGVWFRRNAQQEQLVDPASNATDLTLTDVPGDFVLAWRTPGTLRAKKVSETSPALSLNVTGVAAPSSSAQVPNLIHQNGSGEIALFTMQPSFSELAGRRINNTLLTSKVLSTAFQTGTLIISREATVGVLQVANDANNGAPVPFAVGGEPEALASDPGRQRAVLVQRPPDGLQAQLIGVDPTTTGPHLVGAPIPLLPLQSPQLRPTVAWSAAKGAYLVMWDEFVPPNPAGKLMFSYLQLDGTPTPSQVLGVEVDGGAAPRLVPGLDAGFPLGLLHFGVDGGQRYSELDEMNRQFVNARGISSAISFAARGQSSTLAWNPNSNSVQLWLNWTNRFGGPPLPIPRCVAFKNGKFWLGALSGTSLTTVPEDGGLGDLGLFHPNLSGLGQHCYAVRPVHDTVVVGYRDDAGIQLVSVEAPVGQLIASQPGNGSPLVTPLGSSLLVSWVESQATVKGFIVRADGGIEAPILFGDRALDVREHWAASGPNGSAAVVWQSFDIASGRVLVNARLVFEGPALLMDAGTGSADAGADAGTDAGADGGPGDGGSGDGGPGDGGSSVAQNDGGLDAGFDAGPADVMMLDDAGVGGAPDAGPKAEPVFVPVCGCDGTTGAPLLLAVMLMLRRRAQSP